MQRPLCSKNFRVVPQPQLYSISCRAKKPGVEKWDCFDHFKFFNDSPALDQTTATPSPLDIKQLTGKSLESSSMPLFLVGQKALLSLAKHD